MRAQDHFASAFAAMQAALDERNDTEKAAFAAGRHVVVELSCGANPDDVAAAEQHYDEKIEDMNAAVDAVVATARLFAAVIRASARTPATRLSAFRFEVAASALGEEHDRRYGSRKARRADGNEDLKNADAGFAAAYAEAVTSIRCELGLMLN
jgi:hypothetical protein